MATSSSTVTNLINVIQRHISLEKADELFADLSKVKGNASFTQSMKMMIEEIKARRASVVQR